MYNEYYYNFNINYNFVKMICFLSYIGKYTYNIIINVQYTSYSQTTR